MRTPILHPIGMLLGQMDASRRRMGRMLDQLGLGIAQTPSRITLLGQAMLLRAYPVPSIAGPVLLIVPAPIKRSYIWDLTPHASVVRRCLQAGMRVYLVDWQPPRADQQSLGLAEYADRFLGECLDVIQQETGPRPIFLAGHSLGGTLATIFAALHPQRVAGLILLESPLHFTRPEGALEWLVAQSPRAEVLTSLLGNVPGAFMNTAAYLASPTTFATSRWLDWLSSLSDPQAIHLHVRVERWTLDESPMARRLFEEIVEGLYRENRFMRGLLRVGGQPAVPEGVAAPIVAVVDRRSRVVPPESVLPFLEGVQSPAKQVLWYEGDTGVALQHVGVLVGRTAHRDLWPRALAWMHGAQENEPSPR